jgi:hypothetical protein
MPEFLFSSPTINVEMQNFSISPEKKERPIMLLIIVGRTDGTECELFFYKTISGLHYFTLEIYKNIELCPIF